MIEEQGPQLFIDNPEMQNQMTGGETMQNQAGLTPQKSTGIVPKSGNQQSNMIGKLKSSLKGMFNG
jgi:hypothetical protein